MVTVEDVESWLKEQSIPYFRKGNMIRITSSHVCRHFSDDFHEFVDIYVSGGEIYINDDGVFTWATNKWKEIVRKRISDWEFRDASRAISSFYEHLIKEMKQHDSNRAYVIENYGQHTVVYESELMRIEMEYVFRNRKFVLVGVLITGNEEELERIVHALMNICEVKSDDS